MNCSGQTRGRLSLSWTQPFLSLSPPWLRAAPLSSPELVTPWPEGLEQRAGWYPVQAHSMAAELGQGGNFLQDTLAAVCPSSILSRSTAHAAHGLRGLPPGQAGPAFRLSLFHSHLAGLWSCFARGTLLLFSKPTSQAHFPSHPTPLLFPGNQGC